MMNTAQAAITRYLKREYRHAQLTPYDRLAGLRKALVDARTPWELAAHLKARMMGFRAAEGINWFSISVELLLMPCQRAA